MKTRRVRETHHLEATRSSFWCVSRTLRYCLLLAWSAAVLSADARVALAQDAGGQAAARDFNAAAALQNEGLYPRAAEKWTAFIQQHSNDERLDRAHYCLGICRLHNKQYGEAVQSFQLVLSKYPNFAGADGAQYNMAMAQFQAAGASRKPEDFKTAAAAFAVAASKYPAGKLAPKALHFQGEALFSAGDLPGAVDAYKKAVARPADNPLLAESYYALGTTQQEMKQDAEAAATFRAFLGQSALAAHELAGEVRLRLGASLLGQKKYDEAVNVFAELASKSPQSPHAAAAQLAAGKCYCLMNKWDDAKRTLEPLAAAKKPESAEAAYWLGRALLKLNKPQESLNTLDQALAAHAAGDFVPYLRLARADALYDLPARRKETAALYEDFVKQYPDHALTPQATYMAALAALGEENFASARKHAEAFLANSKLAGHELVPAVLYVAAEAYLLAPQNAGGDAAKAEQLYRQLVARHAQHARVPRAQLRIAWCLHQQKKYDESLKYLNDIRGKLADPACVAEMHWLSGRNHSAAGREKDAVAAYEEAFKAKSDWPRIDEVLVAWAQGLRAAGSPDAAAERLERLLSTCPQSGRRAEALYLLGEIAQQQKKYDNAVARCQELLKQFPQSEFAGPANYVLAAALFAKEEYEKAVAPLGALLGAPGDAELANRARFLRGLIYQRLKQLAPAAQDLQAFVDAKPSAGEALDARYALVLCRIGLGQLDQAQAALDALLREKPDYASADKVYYELGHAQLQQKKTPAAAAAFRALAEKAPDSPLAAESWFHVGRSHEETADAAAAEAEKNAQWGKAAAAYAAGLAKAKTPELREKLRYKLGDVQFRQRQFDQAATTLAALLAEHPNGELAGPARFLAAECLFRRDQFDKAMPLFVQAANDKADKYHAQSLYRAGACAAKLKNWAESQRHYETLIGRFPKFEQLSEARYGSALALQNQNKLAEARAVCEQITKETESETAAKARFMIGEIAFAENKHLDAIEHYLQVAVGYPYKDWQAMARLEIGRCYLALNQRDKAVAAFQTVVDQFPNHAKAADAARLLAELKK